MQRDEPGNGLLLPAVQGLLLPGALGERDAMFQELRQAARAQIEAFDRGLKLGAASSPRRANVALRILNVNGDDQISLLEILSARVAFGDGSVRTLFGRNGFFDAFDIGRIMRLDAGNERLDGLRVSSALEVLLVGDGSMRPNAGF